MAHSATAALVNVAQNALVTGREPVRWGNAHPNLVPYQLFEAEDRPFILAVGNDAQWLACCEAIGRSDLAADPRYLRNAGRVEHRAELIRSLAETLRTRAAGEWMRRLREKGVPAGIVAATTARASGFLDQSVGEHAADGTVECSWSHPYGATRQLLDGLRDRVPVLLAVSEGEQDVKYGWR